MNYFDLQPEELPEIPSYELRHLRNALRFLKEVYARVFSDPPREPEWQWDFWERAFRFPWPRRPDGSAPEGS